MSVNFNQNKDLEEIYLHVKKLKAEHYSIEEKKEGKLNIIEILKNNKEKITDEILANIPSQDIFEIIEEDEPVSKMILNDSGFCDICGQDIIFEENLSGLVLLNKFFACEECCKDASDKVLNSWIETRKAKTEDVKSIAFLLMQEKHKTRLI